MERITTDQAQAALDRATAARGRVAAEVGLPRGYWWGLAAGWVVLGALGDVGPSWLATTATVAFGVGHSVVATRLLDGRRRTAKLQVSAAVAGHRTAPIVVGMLLVLVALTVGIALALHADGARHVGTWSGLFVGAIVGFGGPEILRVLRARLGR
ncbi:hypothetical protein GCM10023201_33810 [Actinomycetospora corticicola]|uniref:4-hydroxybenzoate polyprenyltransferase n=1 Tax=Actinomycetospora corticicola TaxID=663602 RepID=A0A7Y9DS50_9PSEU|nr:hypothetical protein [Actinomycetospora corticicola]NYD34496.1 4-hydroxybenzoate polyprenyltransferase [Actinomycetospora corticicola]